jgi:hypothetical protein
VLEKYTPFPPSLKGLMHKLYGFPHWTVKPPLEEITSEALESAALEYQKIA